MADKFDVVRLYALLAYSVSALLLMVYYFAVTQSNAANFVTAQDYFADYGRPVFWGTLIASCVLVTLIYGRVVIAAYRARPHVPHNEDGQAIMFVFVLWLVLYGFCISIGPLVSTIFYAKPVEATFTVKRTTSGGVRYDYCGRSLIVSGTSRWNRRLCRVDRNLIEHVSPGDQIVVTGRGNHFGMRVQGIEPVQPNGHASPRQ